LRDTIGTGSALYDGTIRHRRLAERSHSFCHRTSMLYLNLEEIDEVVGGVLCRKRPGLVRFRRADYLGDPSKPLDSEVRELVRARLGVEATGPICVLTHARAFGHCFNPVSLYYCFDLCRGDLVALVADVTNTPWGERHAYVFRGTSGVRRLVGTEDKALHVSPFMDMDVRYECHATLPGDSLFVYFRAAKVGVPVLDANLRMRRRPLTKRLLLAETLRHPGGSRLVLALIYLHAAVLWVKGVRMRSHP
jgi:DUF1365 family protein